MESNLAFITKRIDELVREPFVRPPVTTGGRTWTERTRKAPACSSGEIGRLREFAGGRLDASVEAILRNSNGIDLLADDDHGGGFRIRSVDEIIASTEVLRSREDMPGFLIAVAGPMYEPEHVIVDCSTQTGEVRYASDYDPIERWWVAHIGYAGFLAELLARDGDLYWWEHNDPRTGEPIEFPGGRPTASEDSVPRVSQNRRQFMDEWERQGFDTPPGGWGNNRVHHNPPLSQGGDNAFEHQVPVRTDNGDHQAFTNWWRYWLGEP